MVSSKGIGTGRYILENLQVWVNFDRRFYVFWNVIDKNENDDGDR